MKLVLGIICAVGFIGCADVFSPSGSGGKSWPELKHDRLGKVSDSEKRSTGFYATQIAKIAETGGNEIAYFDLILRVLPQADSVPRVSGIKNCELRQTRRGRQQQGTLTRHQWYDDRWPRTDEDETCSVAFTSSETLSESLLNRRSSAAGKVKSRSVSFSWEALDQPEEGGRGQIEKLTFESDEKSFSRAAISYRSDMPGRDSKDVRVNGTAFFTIPNRSELSEIHFSVAVKSDYSTHYLDDSNTKKIGKEIIQITFTGGNEEVVYERERTLDADGNDTTVAHLNGEKLGSQ